LLYTHFNHIVDELTALQGFEIPCFDGEILGNPMIRNAGLSCMA
jgi:hypothetical protein